MRFLITLLIASSVAVHGYGQAQYEITKDEKHPEQHYFRGIVNKYVVQNDTAFAKWYNSSQSYYSPDTATLNAFERSKGKLQFVVFGGTWCEDTQFILPKFFKIQEKSGVPDEAVTFFAVNRDKKTLGNISAAFQVNLVPTIIVMKNGKEIGRVVEYGKTGKWDKELVDLINQ